MTATTGIGRLFDAIGCLLGPLFSDPNIYCAAGLLIRCHGANANTEAARIADTMRGFGDRDGQAFWIKVGQAITELESQPAIGRNSGGAECDPNEGLSWR